MSSRKPDKSKAQSEDERLMREKIPMHIRKAAKAIARDPVLLNLGRVVVQEIVLDFRNRGISVLGRGNGVTCCGKDGRRDGLIRLGTDEAIRHAMLAIAKGQNVWDHFMTTRERREHRKLMRGGSKR